MKVSVVSCVGAYRTGKSALLSWFLRYLRNTSVSKDSEEKKDGEEGEWWMKGGKLTEGERFDWRGGR